MSQKYHLSIDLRGALHNWRDSDWRNCVRADDGRMLTPREVKDEFIDAIAKGHRRIPAGECDNFDEERGCRGHVSTEKHVGGQGPKPERTPVSTETCSVDPKTSTGRFPPPERQGP